ncbi:Crp/Fnr family transcriptional regulator [Roseomonas sp. CECT 9278]|uniref:Crp/Fnr family transcriptional regulator n=1 Tax=Roseomonas sp. CECT 9278 TaxID=2845823 RepID=UPI001E431D16|nr:Crp/Fnr family transcriptional regulator [Roseomonas sp. CECT 9278]CAH0196460.1 CRP-like cAMP-activated global transcriptional regulator [Roseomonas sp. CECT 9278]
MRAIQDPAFPHLVWLRPTMTEPTRTPTLADIAFFRNADPAALAKLAAAVRWRTVEPGQVVVDEDEPSTDIFFVTTGAVRVQLRAASGREVLLNEFGAGEFFGELSAIDGAPRAANVTAIARSRLCIVPAQAFLDFVFATPAACHGLLRTLAAKLRLQTERTLEREALPVRLRLFSELLRLSRPRASAPGERVVSPPPPHHELAARIGARREVVSRELSEMTREGWLARDRRAIRILRVAEMQKLVSAELRAPAA